MQDFLVLLLEPRSTKDAITRGLQDWRSGSRLLRDHGCAYRKASRRTLNVEQRVPFLYRRSSRPEDSLLGMASPPTRGVAVGEEQGDLALDAARDGFEHLRVGWFGATFGSTYSRWVGRAANSMRWTRQTFGEQLRHSIYAIVTPCLMHVSLTSASLATGQPSGDGRFPKTAPHRRKSKATRIRLAPALLRHADALQL